MVYLDNSATTPVCGAAIKAVSETMEKTFANPSSTHCAGLEAKNTLEAARAVIAEKLGASGDEIYFTSGGTEANNLAVFGALGAAAKFRNRRKIVVSEIEHPSVYESAKYLSVEGYDVVFLKPDRHGNISPAQIMDAVDENTALVSLMHTNNEIGSKLPVKTVRAILKAKNSPALLHCDCVQAFCKDNFTVKSLGVDLLSVSSHKIHGPKGAGALYVRKGVRINPVFHGGEQEKRLRPGTEALPLISGFAAAVKDYDTEKYGKKVKELNSYLRQRIKELDGAVLNSDETASDYILGFSLPGYRSETLLNFLSLKGICVSAGSACAGGKQSHVLRVVSEDKEITDSALRVSFSHLNEKGDIDLLIAALKKAEESLVKVR